MRLFALVWIASPAAAVCEMGVLSPNGECICERGFFINIASNCEPCPVATYEKNRECVKCPETKVTLSVAAKSERDCTCDENVEYDAAADICIIRDKSVDLNAKFAFTWRHVTGQTLFGLMYYGIVLLLAFILSKLSHARRAPLMKILVKIEYHFTHNMMYLSVAGFMASFQAFHFVMRSISRETTGTGNAAEFVAAVITIAESVVLCFHSFQTSMAMALQSLVFMLRDSLIIVSSLMMPVQVVQNFPTWFSYGFLGALRAYSVCTRMLNASSTGSLSVKWQVISVLIQTFSVIYVAAAIMFVLETLGEPTEALEEFNSDTWTILSSFYFIFVTISTVGYGDLSPATGLGRAVVLLAIILGISQFGSGIGQVAEAVRLNRSGHGSFTPPPRSECIVVCGNPSAQMLMVFLRELFHADHAEESMHIHVAVLLPEGSEALDLVLKFVRRKANLHILPRVHMLAGSALDPGDQKRAAIEDATALYVLPDIHRPDATQEDLESIVRVLALRRTCPLTRIIVVLHRSIHRELLSGAGAETDAIAIDQLKLQLVGKSTAVPGFSTIVCNLCKTWSTQTKKKPTEAGAAASASADDADFNWSKEYEQGLGSELYEVALSKFYWGTHTFPQVVRDILDKSVKKDVYLIGLVEVEKKPKGRWKKQFAPRGTGKDWQFQDGFMPAPNGRRKRVVLNPGSNYRIRNEPFCDTCGIFIAGDRDAILQPDAMVHKVDEEEEEDSDKEDESAQLTAFNKPKGPKKKVTEEERMQRRAAEQAKLAASQNAEAMMSNDPRFKPRPKKEMLRNKPLRMALKPWEASEPKIVLMNDVYNEGKLPSQYDVDILAEGGHVLFITFTQNSEALGLEYFVGPIRATYMASDGNPGPPIFVLGPSKPADWYAITQFDQCFFVQGNPFLLFDLERVNFQNASAIFVSSPPRSEGGEASMSDADAIFIVRMIESELQLLKLQSGGDREVPPVIAEITSDANHHFLPLPSKGTNNADDDDSDDDFDDPTALANLNTVLATPVQILQQADQATTLAAKQRELSQQVTTLTAKLADALAGEESDDDMPAPGGRKTVRRNSVTTEQAMRHQKNAAKATNLQAQLTQAVSLLQQATALTTSNLETTAKTTIASSHPGLQQGQKKAEKQGMFSTALSLGSEWARAARARKKAAAKAAAVPSSLDGDYLIQPRYACGRLFASSIVTSLAVNTYYNPSLAKLIEEMIDSRIVMIDVGRGWNEESYYDLFQFVLEQRDLLPIGIFRRAALPVGTKTEAADQKRRKDRLRQQAQARMMGKRVTGAKKQEPPDYYVYAAPTARSTFVTEMDQIICIMRKDWTGIPSQYSPTPMAGGTMGMGMLGNQPMHQLGNQMNTTALAMSQGGQTPGGMGRQTMDMVGMSMTPQTLAFGDPQSPHMQLPAGSPNWAGRSSPGAMRELQGGPAVGGPVPYPSPHQGSWAQAYSPSNTHLQTQGQAALPAPGNLPPGPPMQ